MPRIAWPTAGLIITPAVLAAFGELELRHSGGLAALAGAWCMFVVGIFAIQCWGALQLARSRQRLQDRRSDRPKTR